MITSHDNPLITLRQQLEAWFDTLRAQGRADRTRETYRSYLLPFIDWCEQRSVRYPAQVTLVLLESWQRYLRAYRKADGQPYGNNGQRERLIALRLWFRWLLQRHHILYNPAEQMVLPKEEKRLPAQILSERETTQVLESLDDQSVLGFRNRVMLEILWSSGIRRMELRQLQRGDIDFERGAVVVNQGKGNKDRVVPVGERALGWLQRYLANVRPQLAAHYDSGYLFISQKGRPLSLGHLTQIAGKAIRQQAHLDKPGACHLFRHSMATQMLDNGADIRHIQAMLGHEKLNTTEIYTRVAIGHLKKVHKQTHPAERDTPTAPESRADHANGKRGAEPKPQRTGQPGRPR
ncbi:site-specific tyrosine recombinase XerC [Xenorhabdus griffiniae]|uniref:Site-specific tyrosine recombinase XerC n=1 Tax=Xenorhabdus griffiniae TaxID=351672 RepID=A0ABY9XHF7_9GAMM|nr:site-specific tyrosine recombinase XerC [Xenorhabdus griffiniae]MBE8589392.1 site-specific tyrosine recombinase XerC [Xenorhabdus griffiniae]WMV72361.1 site-specific tyrosine recombinase XerC [Xenorhabdus griffiniae]WMV72366.1 site-specific tyrosine recombinase XerC [Xenorhabdus griffiniae]WNH02039.1 site-specific tyrosine recombinase XerC [Xenorhabdus griffiniae]WNH02044.1 site-specific tyrosine recombinase XerC [Xenorhabdus griffiniae]